MAQLDQSDGCNHITINTVLNDDITVLNDYAYINEYETKAMSQLIKEGIRFKKEKSLEENF